MTMPPFPQEGYPRDGHPEDPPWTPWAQAVHAAAAAVTTGRLTDDALGAAFVSAGEGGLLVDALASETVVGDGLADDSAALQALLTFIAPWGGTLLVGKHYLAATITPAAGVKIQGRDDQSGFVIPADGTYAAVTVDSVPRFVVENLRVTSTGEAVLAGHAAVAVLGESPHGVIRNVWADGLHDGFRTDGGLGTTPGTVRHLLLDNCRATNSNTYGYRLDDVDGMEMRSCSSDVSGFDGIKLRKLARNITITGGYYTGSVGGDGIDAYAGGSNFTIQGADFSGNGVNGITIKTDDENKADPATFGMPQNVTLVGVRSHNNGGSGLWIGRNGSTDDTTEPLFARATVLGGSFNGNTQHGIIIRSRSVVLDGVQAARNQWNGIQVDPAALDVSIIAPQVAGNGAGGTVYDGIYVAGKRVQVIGGASIGTDPDGATTDADLAAGTKTQRYGLVLAATASDAVVIGITLQHNRTAPLLDSSAGAMILSGVTDPAAALLTLPNNRRIYGRKADGSLLSMMYVTAGGGINLGDVGANMSILGAATLTVFPKIAAQAELQVVGALNHDGTTVGFNGATPVVKAASPGTATGTDAAVINAIVTALRNLGLVT